MTSRLGGYEETICLGTLAVAYAWPGRLEEAIRTAENALGLAADADFKEVIQRNDELLQPYRVGKQKAVSRSD